MNLPRFGSTPVTCADDERNLRDIDDDDRIRDVVFFGLEDEDTRTRSSNSAPSPE